MNRKIISGMKGTMQYRVPCEKWYNVLGATMFNDIEIAICTPTMFNDMEYWTYPYCV